MRSTTGPAWPVSQQVPTTTKFFVAKRGRWRPLGSRADRKGLAIFDWWLQRLSPSPSQVPPLPINYGAYMSEIYRAGIEAIDRSQWEAAHALS